MQIQRTSTVTAASSPKTPRTARALVAAAAVTAAHLAAFTPDLHAVSVTWDGGGASDSILTPANWANDSLPGTADDAFFAGAVRTTPDAIAPVQYRALFFAAGASPFNVTGTGAITLGATAATPGFGGTNSNYLNNDTVGVTQTISAPINFIGGNINATQGSLVFNGLLNLGNGGSAAGNAVTVNTAANNVTLAGGLSSAYTDTVAGLTKTGTGNLVLTGSGAGYNGRVFINGGNLRITSGTALGSGPGQIETALSSGGTGLGTLELDGTAGGFTLGKLVTTRARQDATINEVSVRNVAGNNTITTVGTGTGGSRFNYESAGGNLTINTWNTTGSGGSRSLRLLGAASGQINNWTPAIGNVVALIKDGAGTWTLGAGMSNADSAFGTVTVNGGNLILAGGLGARVTGVAGATAPVRPDVTVNNGGTLTVVSTDGTTGEVGNGTTPGILTVAQGGTLDASTFSDYSLQIAQTLVGAGTVKAGRLSAYGDNAIHIGNSTATTAVGTLTVQGNLFLSNQFSTATGGLYYNLGNVTTPGAGVNDLISVQGNLIVDNSGGPINVRLTTLGSGLTTGTYRLIETTSGATPNASDFSLLGFAPGTTRQSATLQSAPGQLNLVVSGAAANLVWKGDGGANVWESAGAANFLNGAVADKFFPFDNATFNDTTANKTVAINGNVTLGSATVDTAATYTFTGSGAIDGGGTLTKSGTGTLILANVGPNTYSGGTTISAGTLQIGNGGADGSLGTGAVVNNGTLAVDKSAGTTLPLVSGSGSLVKRGSGFLALNPANTYTGATLIEAGTVNADGPVGGGLSTAFGSAGAGTTVASGATVYFAGPPSTYDEAFTISGDGVLDAGLGTGALRFGGGAVTTLTAPVLLAANTTLNGDGGATLLLNNTLTGTGDLTKIGGGTLNFAVPGSAWTGGLNVNAGTVVIGNTSTTWTGPTTVAAGATLQLGTGTVAPALSGSSLSLLGTLSFGSSQNITEAGTYTGNGTIAQGTGGGTTTLTGNLTGFTGTLQTSQGGAESTLVVATPTGATAANVDSAGSGNGIGVLRITSSNALAPTAILRNRSQQAVGTGRIELGNNVNLTVATIEINQKNNTTPSIVSTDGNNTLTGNLDIYTGGGNANMQADAGSHFTIAGTVQTGPGVGTPRHFTLQGDGTGTVTAVIQNSTTNVQTNVVKRGAGTWTLTGANTTTGTTTVEAGTLVLTTPAFAPVTTSAGGAILNGGKLVLDYAGGGLPATIVADLKDSHDTANFTDASKRYRTTLANNPQRGLGYIDDAAAMKFSIAYTWYGDANLDGRINGDDYALLDRGRARNLTGWVNGDFNYDGAVNTADYLLIDTSLGQQNGALSPDLLALRQAEFGSQYVAALVAAVPEPTTLGLVAAASLATLSRRRRAR